MNLNLSSITTFDFYYNIEFWLFFIPIVILFRLFSFNLRVRDFFLFVCNVFMLLALPRFTVSSLFFLLLIASTVFLLGHLLNNDVSIKNKTKRILTASIGIFAVVAILSFFKYSFFQNIVYQKIISRGVGASEYIFLIGISYSSFKMMHFIIECYKKKIVGLNYLNFLNYIFFFSAFISGPINRYNQFSKQLDFKSENSIKSDVKTGTERVLHGLFKKFVLCTIVYPYALVSMPGPVTELSAYQIMLGLYAYTFYFYFDFSGYSDIAIGSARIMGIELPENFNYPFLKKNIQQLWANWHISLTTWLTDYIYWPLARRMRKIAFFRKRPITLSNISIIVTFVVCGMWHGDTLNFVIWGSYHGVGLAVLNIYQKQKRKIRNSFVRSYFQSKYSEFVGIIATFHFFTFGILFFAMDISKIKQLLF